MILRVPMLALTLGAALSGCSTTPRTTEAHTAFQVIERHTMLGDAAAAGDES